MLTRLKISGFKNLHEVDIRFGPFTCIAGVNGVGKSNLFDAILFLSHLADQSLLDAALMVRDEGGRAADIRSLFHRAGDNVAEKIRFEAEMIVPSQGVDDLGQTAKASTTFLQYIVEIGYRLDDSVPSRGFLELLEENLFYLRKSDASRHLRFKHDINKWRNSAIIGKRTSSFITTAKEGDNRVIHLHQDGTGGRPKKVLAKTAPKTVLSTVNAESPTAFLARSEMRSWRLLQLEPSALRSPDDFSTKPGMKPNGGHLPATISNLARARLQQGLSQNMEIAEAWIYDQLAAKLSELIDDIYSVEIDRDEKRELLTLRIRDRDGTVHPARALSDGTLRFIALATIEIGAVANGVICMEEPENGIHPSRVSAMLALLQDIAVDVHAPIDEENPLRQVIINTHSPLVVQQVPDHSLLIAESIEVVAEDDYRFKAVHFSCLSNTWRDKAEGKNGGVLMGKLLSYLNPAKEAADVSNGDSDFKKKSSEQRVIDREDVRTLQLPLPLFNK